MNISAHTPGPWNCEWVVDGAFEVRGQVQGDNCVIASRAPFPSRHSEFVANARLIAAAPDLLAALYRVEEFLRNGIELGYIRMPDPGLPDAANELPGIVGAAIQSATGSEA